MKTPRKTAQNIHLFRYLNHMHQRALAENTGIPLKCLQKIEKGEVDATEGQLESIAKEFKVSVYCLRIFDFDQAVNLFMENHHSQLSNQYSG